MIKRLTKTGNSVAVVLDRQMLEAAHLDEGAEVEVSTNGDVIVITPVRDKKRAAKFKAAHDAIKEQFANLMRAIKKDLQQQGKSTADAGLRGTSTADAGRALRRAA